MIKRTRTEINGVSHSLPKFLIIFLPSESASQKQALIFAYFAWDDFSLGLVL